MSIEEIVPAPVPEPTAAVLTVGDELLSGEVADTNSAAASIALRGRGYRVTEHRTVGDSLGAISAAVRSLLHADAVVVIGGLGPTSDDVTRFGLADALGRELEHRAEAWDAVVERLTRFGLAVHESNRRQALFPEGSELLPNANGTAWGALLTAGDTRVVLLPGPPKECRPMLTDALDRFAAAVVPADRARWRTLGLIEGDVAAAVDEAVADSGTGVTPSYRWHYPFVDIGLSCPPGAHPALEARIDGILDGHVVSRAGRTAFEELALAAEGTALTLDDRLTEGLLAERLGRLGLLAPTGPGSLTGPGSPTSPGRPVEAAAWAEGPGPDTAQEHAATWDLRCSVRTSDGSRTFALTVPRRGPEVREYAAEFVAWSVLRALRAPAQHPDRTLA
ncbi:molybdopterin-binding protein [Streptomyces cinnamoneus]|uniref:competence/damage-inducible protein A n=1 Tax=Streptomyces cinnamoneus TaxID=53446 RepID=UPI0034148CAB